MPYSSASPDFDPGKCTVKQLRLRIRIEGTIPPLADARPLGKLDAFKLALTDANECPARTLRRPPSQTATDSPSAHLGDERQLLVIHVEANLFGRQVLDNATEIIEVASAIRLSQTSVAEKVPTSRAPTQSVCSCRRIVTSWASLPTTLPTISGP